MNASLPSPFVRDLARLGVFLAALGGCAKEPRPVAPGPTIAADPVVSLRSMDEECDGMLAALRTYKACPNLEDEDRSDLDGWIESATANLAAGKKANPDDRAQRAIALACHRATASVEAATQRCAAGPRPKDR